MKKTARISALSALAGALLLAACASGGSGSATPGQDVPAHLVQLMHESAAAWNRADLDGFLATYANDPRTAFIGAEVTLGLDSIRARYIRSYFKDGKPPRDQLDTRMLGPNHALMRGRCILTNPADNAKTYCRYTLVWERRPEGWRIIHDHSS